MRRDSEPARLIRHLFVLCIALLPQLALAYGDRAPIDIELFHPAPGDARLLSIDLARVGEHKAWVPQTFLHYADRQLVLICNGNCLPRQYIPLVAHRLTADLSLALSLAGRVQLALSLPITFYQYSDPAIAASQSIPRSAGGNLAPVPSPGGIGNIRLHAKVALLPARSMFGLGLDGALALPSGDGNSFLGTQLPTFTSRLLAHVEYKSLTLALNFGGRFAESVQVLNLPSGIALVYGMGGQVKIFGTGKDVPPFYLLSEIYGLAFTSFNPSSDFPTEFLIAAKSEPGNWSLMAGAGSTLVPGAGTPNVRFFVGISYSSKRSGR